MPSSGEEFGFVILEAMACGIPPVAIKVGKIQEAVCDGRLGLLVDPDKPEEIMSTVFKALDEVSFLRGWHIFPAGASRIVAIKSLTGYEQDGEKGMDT